MSKIKTKLDQEIGKRIRAKRAAKNLTLKQLAPQLNLAYQQVQHYEKGRCQITVSKLAEVAKALGVKFKDLLPKNLLD